MMSNFDAIVIGAGHAGIEAARAISTMGFRVGLLTMDISKTGAMSCNPAIGGVAKSHLVAEIDALGGFMGYVADSSSIQSRRLNMTKGPAVRSTRLQCDKDRYVRTMAGQLRTLQNLELIKGEASAVEVRGETWRVRTMCGLLLSSRTIVITAGTFMRGLMFCGEERNEGGRVGDAAAKKLSESLCELGHELARLKTGTPARLNAATINFENLDQQWGDPELRRFSWRNPKEKLPQLCCYITHTSERTHEIIRANFDKSPLFSGDIVGVGPRYCPSIEDKVRRFADRSRHQIFLEPEGLDTNSVYPNGMSTSLPRGVQLEFLRSIAGLERVEMLRPGYAVEYDTIDPTSLQPSFMSKHAEGLYCAGQVNRSSGYEEAAAQGLWAGINAGLYLKGESALVPDRSRSYMETLVDDLTSKGTEEPYRLFTSRSEYRLVLREDNAHERFFALGKRLGLISGEQTRYFEKYTEELGRAKALLEGERIRVSQDRVISLREYLRRPEVRWEDFDPGARGWEISDRAVERIEVEAKYDGYLVRQDVELAALAKLKNWHLDPEFDIDTVSSLSAEAIEKFKLHKPKSVYELSKISGISPLAVISIVKVAARQSVSHETIL